MLQSRDKVARQNRAKKIAGVTSVLAYAKLGRGFNSQHGRVVAWQFVVCLLFTFVLFKIAKLLMEPSADVIGDGFDMDDETTFLFTSESVGEGHPGTSYRRPGSWCWYFERSHWLKCRPDGTVILIVECVCGTRCRVLHRVYVKPSSKYPLGIYRRYFTFFSERRGC